VTPPEWILWAATVGFGSTLSERFAAAVENGYGWVSLSPAEVLEADRGGPQDPFGRGHLDKATAYLVEWIHIK